MIFLFTYTLNYLNSTNLCFKYTIHQCIFIARALLNLTAIRLVSAGTRLFYTKSIFDKIQFLEFGYQKPTIRPTSFCGPFIIHGYCG